MSCLGTLKEIFIINFFFCIEYNFLQKFFKTLMSTLIIFKYFYIYFLMEFKIIFPY